MFQQFKGLTKFREMLLQGGRKLVSYRELNAYRSAVKLQTSHGVTKGSCTLSSFSTGESIHIQTFNTHLTDAISCVGNFHKIHTHSWSCVVTIHSQQEETVAFADRNKQETFPWEVMTWHHFRQIQSCWHYGFGVTPNYVMFILFPGIPHEQQLHTLGPVASDSSRAVFDTQRSLVAHTQAKPLSSYSSFSS